MASGNSSSKAPSKKMDHQIFTFLLQDGVTMGAIYVLLAIALVMVFNVTRIVFVAQGEFVSYTALTLAVFDTGHVPATVWLLLGVGVVAFGMELVSSSRSLAAAGRGLIGPAF